MKKFIITNMKRFLSFAIISIMLISCGKSGKIVYQEEFCSFAGHQLTYTYPVTPLHRGDYLKVTASSELPVRISLDGNIIGSNSVNVQMNERGSFKLHISLQVGEHWVGMNSHTIVVK